MLTILFHPISTFVTGLLAGVAAILLLLNSFVPRNHSDVVASYRSSMDKVEPSGLEVGSAAEKVAIGRFKSFLESLGDPQYVHENTKKSYAKDAYLDDTLVTHHGADEIEAYFAKTSATMTSYQVTIDDMARSGNDYYFRWTMNFAAPAMNGGKPLRSVGISQIRFDRDGKVAFHQDFWDSGKNFYAHLPVVGGVIGFVRKRLGSN